MINNGLGPSLDKIVDAAFEASRWKKGPVETRRRLKAIILPFADELVAIGLDQAIVLASKRRAEIMRLPVKPQLPTMAPLILTEPEPEKLPPPQLTYPLNPPVRKTPSMRWLPWTLLAVTLVLIVGFILVGYVQVTSTFNGFLDTILRGFK